MVIFGYISYSAEDAPPIKPRIAAHIDRITIIIATRILPNIANAFIASPPK